MKRKITVKHTSQLKSRLLILMLLLPALTYSQHERSIYDFKIHLIDGNMIDLADFKGKKILIVNTASHCGYTPQYESLEKVYKANRDKLVVIGFPSDNFGGQEFDDNAAIQSFCEKNYHITFPLSVKVDVKGKNAHPLFLYLTQTSMNGELDAEIKWNFNKFLIDENGKLLAHFGSKVLPEDIIR